MPLRLLLSALLLLSAFAPLAPRPDFAGLYRDAPALQVDTRREGDSLRFFLRVPDATRLRGGLRVAAWPSYEARAPLWQDSVPRRAWRVRPEGEGARLSFYLPAARLQNGAVLHLQIGQPSTDSYQDAGTNAWLRLTADHLGRAFVLTDSLGLPLLRRYVRAGEVFGVESYGIYQPVRWKRYDIRPVAALPPMSSPRAVAGGPAILPVLDSATTAPGEQLQFDEPGLYALKVGGAGGVAARTVAVQVAPNQYPALTSASELIEPLLYLTTSQERQRLTNAPDPKRAVDRYWLDVARGNKEQGKKLIRSYYGRVTAANHLFAAHKAGWLTDRGLLYVVLGPPPGVRRLSSGEERWYYPEAGVGGSPVTFSFRPKPSTFAPDYYELVRRPEYELLWYAAVEQWRTPPTAPSAPTDRNR